MTFVDHQTATSDQPPSDAGVRVRAHPGLCEGWGNCHRFAPRVYPLDEEGFLDVHLLAVPADHASDAWLGASACPERAITVIGAPSPPRPSLDRSEPEAP